MQVDFDSIKPIYLQIAQAIEDDILLGILCEGQPSYSQLTLSKELGVNPATAAKGINLLVTEGILIKERGKSMIVAPGAKQRLINEKQKDDLSHLATELITEAQKIKLPKEAVIALIEQAYKNTNQSLTANSLNESGGACPVQ